MTHATPRPAPLARIFLAVSVALNVVMLALLLVRASPSESTPAASPADTASPGLLSAALDAAPASSAAPAHVDVASPEDDPASTAAAPAGNAEPTAAAAPALGELQIVRGAVEGSIPQSLARLQVDDSDAVSAAFTRLLMWDLDLRRDLRAGDTFAIAYRTDGAGVVEVEGSRYHSQRLGRTLAAYRYRPDDEPFQRYFDADGVEIEHQLTRSPIHDYEQITSLLRDRPNHHGLDFKTPVGTPVSAPFAGRVTRSNWNWSANGNCIEVRFEDGMVAKYLHLSENRVEPGERVEPGQVIALSGNTGRSSGPHLHYQLERGGRVVDPVDHHGTERRSLDGGDVTPFRSAVGRIDGLLGGVSSAAGHP